MTSTERAQRDGFALWWHGAKQHPGWGLAIFYAALMIVAGVQADAPWWLVVPLAALWPSIVIATCTGVAEANP